jgi:hypothetical protein
MYTAVRPIVVLVCVPLVWALGAACGRDPAPATECIQVVEESGQATDECLPVAADSQRVDLSVPTFSHPTPITNPLHPTTRVEQAIYGGHVDGKPFRTEVSLMPGTRPISWAGTTVDTAITQYVAYLDGRIHEVALDWYAQADDGSVWYFGEDVFNYEDGRVAGTEGTWIAGGETPAAMIMPAKPAVGNVYRPENAPGVVFEEVRVEKVDQDVAGPNGNISGAIEVSELHMDGKREGKIFAPGYGEFSTGSEAGDLEAVSLAVPTDARRGTAPAEFGALSSAVNDVFAAAGAADAKYVTRAVPALRRAWDAMSHSGVPPVLQSQMTTDIDGLSQAVAATDWPSAQTAALRIAQNELDLRLLHHRVIDVDLARLALWARQLPIDVAAENAAFLQADVAALERVWERIRHAVERATVEATLHRLRRAAEAEDLPAVDRAAAELNNALAGLRAP